jgi:hypothetical protein
MSRAYVNPRRAPVLRWLLCTAGCVAGIGLGIGGSMLAPWGWAHPPHSLDVEQEPAPGVLLLSGEDAAVVQADTLRHHGPPPMAAGSVLFIRGSRHGRMALRVVCISGGVLQIGAEPAITWTPTGTSIGDLIGVAACAEHHLLRDLPAVLT